MDFSLKTLCMNVAKAAPIALVSTEVSALVGRFGAHAFSRQATVSTAYVSVLFSQYMDSYFKNDVNPENNEIRKNKWKERLASNFAIALSAAAITAKFVLKQSVLDYKGILVTSVVITAVKYALEALYKFVQNKYVDIKENIQSARLIRNERNFLATLNAEAINSLSPDQISLWNPSNMRHIPADVIQHFNEEQIQGFTLAQYGSMTKEQRNHFTEEQLGFIPQEIWDLLTEEQKNQLSSSPEEGVPLKDRT